MNAIFKAMTRYIEEVIRQYPFLIFRIERKTWERYNAVIVFCRQKDKPPPVQDYPIVIIRPTADGKGYLIKKSFMQVTTCRTASDALKKAKGIIEKRCASIGNGR